MQAPLLTHVINALHYRITPFVYVFVKDNNFTVDDYRYILQSSSASKYYNFFTEQIGQNKIKINNDCIDDILSNHNIHNKIDCVKYLVNNGFEPDSKSLILTIDNDQYDILVFFLEFGVDPNKTHYDLLAKNKMEFCYFKALFKYSDSIYSCFNNIYDKNKMCYPLDLANEEHLFFLEDSYYNFAVDQIFIKKNFIPTYKTLEYACETNNKLLVCICLEFNICPEMECLYFACKNANPDIIEKLIEMKIVPDEKSILLAMNHSYINIECIIFLLENGGVITLNILENFITNEQLFSSIECLEKYLPNHKLIYDVCHIYNKQDIPQFIITDINEKLLFLREFVKNHELSDIKNFIQRHNLSLDSYCYDNMLLNELDDVYLFAIESIAQNDENKYKPTIQSILRINNLSHRFKIYKLISKYL